MVDTPYADAALARLRENETKPFTPPAERPPMPPDEFLPPGYQWVWVEERVDKRGKRNAAHWRKWPTKMKAKGKKKPGAKPVGRPPKVVRPQFTGQAHAVRVYERLATPLAYFVALAPTGIGPMHDVMRECISAIDDARNFVDRFTGGPDAE